MTIKRTLGPAIPQDVLEEMASCGATDGCPELGLSEATYKVLYATIAANRALEDSHHLLVELLAALLTDQNSHRIHPVYSALENGTFISDIHLLVALGAAGFYLGACHARNNPDYEPDHAVLFKVQDFLTEQAEDDDRETIRQFLESQKGGAAHAG